MKARRPVERPHGGFDPRPATVVATFFGSGFFPRAPATAASAVVAVLLFWAGAAALGLRLALLVVVTAGGVWAAGRTEARYGHDARCIVIDEVAGMLVATLLIPWTPGYLLMAFLLFRALDVLKPPPVYQVESLPGGWGIMADDLVAGAYTLLLLFIARLLLPSA